MNLDFITIDPEISGGIPVFTGTRVPIDTLFAYLKAGDSLEEFHDDFPSVQDEAVQALLAWSEQKLMMELGYEHFA